MSIFLILKRGLACGGGILLLLLIVCAFFTVPTAMALLLMLAIQLGISFAMVGRGNRRAWLLLMPFVWGLLFALPCYLGRGIHTFVPTLLAFIYMPVGLGLFYTAAHQFRLCRAA
jgi:hypothetical protein